MLQLLSSISRNLIFVSRTGGGGGGIHDFKFVSSKDYAFLSCNKKLTAMSYLPKAFKDVLLLFLSQVNIGSYAGELAS